MIRGTVGPEESPPQPCESKLRRGQPFTHLLQSSRYRTEWALKIKRDPSAQAESSGRSRFRLRDPCERWGASIVSFKRCIQASGHRKLTGADDHSSSSNGVSRQERRNQGEEEPITSSITSFGRPRGRVVTSKPICFTVCSDHSGFPSAVSRLARGAPDTDHSVWGCRRHEQLLLAYHLRTSSRRVCLPSQAVHRTTFN